LLLLVMAVFVERALLPMALLLTLLVWLAVLTIVAATAACMTRTCSDVLGRGTACCLPPSDAVHCCAYCCTAVLARAWL
jgi:hypothetical protein